MKKVHIIGGGTVNYVRSHLALAAPAYGTTAKLLHKYCAIQNNPIEDQYKVMPSDTFRWELAPNINRLELCLHLTRMAGGESNLETTGDVALLVESLVRDPDTKIIFFPVSMCDFVGIVGEPRDSHKNGPRLNSRKLFDNKMLLGPFPKIISEIRRNRKDIFLVGFKMTFGATEDEQYIAGLNLCKESSCNLVLANDTQSRLNMVVTPEEARYHVTQNREEALKGLVEMAYLRSHLTFTRSTVVAGEPVPWHSCLIPESLQFIVNYCINRGAYKPFRGATAGHFAFKVNDTTFLTSRRKTNFNELGKLGLVKVVTDGPDSVIAYGSKPSVGGQSQRIVFEEHQDYDCIVHFHCPKNEASKVPTISQREYECGSHQCGQNTSRGLKRFGNLSAVYLDQHGPNIVFHSSIDPHEVTRFIESNFLLNEKTGGAVA